ncbi:hypothetical protein B7P43_G14619 [Cryptotermes secundus]|uniref:HAT C-terminal dimerisation domain-containing protein n=1 Tax=Cryptotermes secundus TaxID=105785 RepID=A0A2J7RS94_9NEOP|nr:hypothetical protein B7P43_G14619 [Cryptotermes secundus]
MALQQEISPKKYKITLTEYNLDWNRLQCVTVDGGKHMSGIKICLVGQITKACEDAGISKPMFLHCVIHQQALCAKHVDMSSVLKPVISIVNFIRCHALNHRQFRSFLEECDSELTDLTYYTAVRWLSCGKVLSRFFQLRNESDIFLTEKNHHETLLSDTECDLFALIKAFRAKLILLESQVKNCNFVHMLYCAEFHKKGEAEFPSSFANLVISDLKEQFWKIFADLDSSVQEIRLFPNPFDCDATYVPSQIPMEIIELQKDKYRERNLIELYKFLNSKQFPNLKKFACKFISIFGTTYMCEQTFSKMKYIKSKYRANLSDEHLKSLLVISVSKF